MTLVSAPTETTLRGHLRAIAYGEQLAHEDELIDLFQQHAVAALAILDDGVETELRVTTPSGFKVYKPARIVSDWTPGANEPPAHGWPVLPPPPAKTPQEEADHA